MTLVLAIKFDRGVLVAADGEIGVGDLRYTGPKLVERRGYVIGGAGDGDAVERVMRHWGGGSLTSLTLTVQASRVPAGTEFLVANASRIRLVDHAGEVLRPPGRDLFLAVGGGGTVATGYLGAHLEHGVRKCISADHARDAAARTLRFVTAHCPGVGRPFSYRVLT